MRPFGFSTGALAPGDFDQALKMLDGITVEAIELSALRIRELPRLLEFVSRSRSDLTRFSHISVHAPTDYTSDQEAAVVEQLTRFNERGWPVIAHPDVIRDYSLWKQMGSFLFLENMDKRKPVGRTVEELKRIFDKLPDAQMCFDIAHARQVDTSMTIAYRIAQAFRGMIKQIHISTVNTSSRHDLITPNAAHAFQALAPLIPSTIPAILETPVRHGQLTEQLDMAINSLDTSLISHSD
jgi:hypothetical protein